jgi:hypothetical protein
VKAWVVFLWVLLVLAFVIGPPLVAPELVNGTRAKQALIKPARPWRSLALPPVAKPPQPQLIGAGTPYETPYFVFRGARNGPVVLVEAGIHGDELAGTYALDEIVREIKVDAGAVVVIPRMNMPAVERHVRFINYDLNRAFADPSRRAPYEFPLAQEIMAVAGREKVDYVITLHEAHQAYDPAVVQGLGQSICYGVLPTPPYLKDWIGALNARIADPRQHFLARYFPIPTSSTEVMVANLRLKGGFCVETWREFAMPYRVQLQRAAVETFLLTVHVGYHLDGRR